MSPIIRILSVVAARLPCLALLPPLLLVAVLVSACGNATEPVIVEVTREVPVEVPGTVSEPVEIIREMPVEVTRVVTEEVEVVREVPVEVTRVVPREVVREVIKEVVATPTTVTATPRPIRRPTLAPTATPRPTAEPEIGGPPSLFPAATPGPTAPPPTATPRPTAGPEIEGPPSLFPLATPSPTAIPPTASPHPNGRLAYNSKKHGNYDIFVVNGDGSERRRLTYGLEDDYVFDISSNGRLLFQGEDRHLYTMNSHGSEVKLIHPSHIIGNAHLSRIKGGAHGKIEWFAWSPDGRQLAIQAQLTRASGDKNWDIYITNPANNRDPRRVTEGQRPRWSPSGGRLAFYSTSEGKPYLSVIDADGANRRRLTNRTGRNPDWSPDGRRIAFEAERDGNTDIYVVNVNGSGETRLTTHPGKDTRPRWTPDGQWISFASSRQGEWNIFAKRLGGTRTVQLTFPSDASIKYHAWTDR